MSVADRRPTLTPYPSIGLAEAIERARTLYGQVHRRRMSREEIAKLLGYAGLNGASVETISNLTKFGLIEGRKDDIRISDDAAVILIEPPGSPDRVPALRRLARRPELFAELAEDFEGTVPPGENAIRIRLERRGFPPRAAQAASRAYRETMELVASEGSEYNQPQVAQNEDDHGGTMLQLSTSAEAPLPMRAAASTQPKLLSQAPEPLAEGGLWLQVPFKGAALSVRIEVTGQSLTKEHVARVRKYLELAEADLEEGGVGATAPKGD